jgi:hypothetical protein
MADGQKPNKPLFSQHYLKHRIQESPEWQVDVRVGFEAFNKLYLSKKDLLPKLSEAQTTDEIREQTEPKVQQLIELTKANQQAYRDVLDWFKSRFGIEKLGQKLERFATLSEDEFLAELRKRIPKQGKSGDPLGVAGQKEVKQLYDNYGLPIQSRNREILQLEHQVSDLVNQAYGLTPEDIDLMWRTAPPRMPIQRNTQPEIGG